ncbi:MAG TPA: hypothetical protein VMX76_00005 [Nevskiaceae bacterium]|nr:hypothetical protein [Nevskiaceae bacterium]
MAKAKKNSGKKIEIIGLGLLVLVVVAGLVFLVFKQPPVSRVPIAVPTFTPNLLVSPIPDFADDWQIYTNRQYSYSVCYPPEWQIDETRPQPPDSIVKVYSPRWEHHYPWGVSVNITVDSADSARNHFDKLRSREESVVSDNEIEDITFAGISCLKVTSKLPKAGGFGSQTVCFKNNLVYQIQTFVYSPSAEEKELGEQVILTFRFLN